ncbi:DeoR/GlpR family DNA-binding transcription regulator [Amphibacillus sp. Q70]|uniref:DeoR/GlpR family DNA-binding transcription regulator n=1 Tax=Amphibacillus sp. Q70 TaxID=3453416 RepID=UPI003F83EF91
MKRSYEEVQARRNQLVNRMRELKVADVKTLSQEFGVSEMTIRRDCAILNEMGQIKQSFGKIEIQNTDINNTKTSDSITHIKDCLAKEAGRFVSDRDTVFINTSSTAIQALAYLTDKAINVLTNNTKIIHMNHHPKSTIVLSGGELRYPKEALSGDIAMESFSNARSDVTIIGCSGLNVEMGISTSVIHEARINTKIIENSGKVIVVADYRKIGKYSNFTIGQISVIDVLITDTYADQTVLDAIEKHGVQIIQVPC